MLRRGGRPSSGVSRPGSRASVVAAVLLVTIVAPVTAPAGALVGARTAAAAGGCPPSGCVDVAPDPKDAAFLGTGGLLIPADSFTGTDAERRAVAACPDCQWALVPVCKRGQQPGLGCGPAATSCPPGSRRMVVLLRQPPATTWSTVGSSCVSGAPVTVDDVARRLSDVVLERVPPLAPSYQPPGGTVVNLPTIFASGQPARLDTRTFSLVGFTVVLDARATWRWDFGDGTTLTTGEPGGRWPDRAVSHAYATAGQASVRVTAQWEGWFTVDGLGPFAVGGPPVEQVSGPLPLTVHEARAVLVGE